MVQNQESKVQVLPKHENTLLTLQKGRIGKNRILRFNTIAFIAPQWLSCAENDLSHEICYTLLIKAHKKVAEYLIFL